MKNQYAGDLGDFGKYGLLRALCGHPNSDPSLSVGVVWYLTPDEDRTADGKHVGYLTEPPRKNPELYRACDHRLYDALARIIERNVRSVGTIQGGAVLPGGTAFYKELLTFEGMPSSGTAARDKRLARRARWLQGALDETLGCDIVFLDPDKGLEIPSTGRHEKDGPQYAFFDEALQFRAREQSLVIYQHLHHLSKAESQIRGRLAQIRRRLDSADTAFALLYHRGTARAFFVIPADAHEKILRERALELTRGPWGRHEHFDEKIYLSRET